MTTGRALAVTGAGFLLATSIGCRPRPPSADPRDCLRLEAPAGPVGFGARFFVRATLACDLAGGRIDWRQLAGPALHDGAAQAGGKTFSALMPSIADATGAPPPWGIVPVSPRTRGDVAIEATWTGDDGRRLRAEAHVTAATRSRGLPNTPVGARIHLGGDGWHVLARPAGSTAALDAAPGAASLLPDIAGEWRLADGDGRTLALRTARYDETPLDCGRAGCHADITAAAARSPMTTVMARGLARTPDGGRAFGPDYPACAIACHATGDPGLNDGGFSHVAAELGAAGEPRRSWDELPRALRRLGGVGCLACHGPAAIPEPASRWAVLRDDVCAVCHDAPPRYGHVVAWRGSRMAHADHDARARSDRACVRCHTTWGFLETLDRPPGERDRRVDRSPPPHAGPVGITCAACHAVHDRDTGGPAGHLLRAPPAPPLFAATGADATAAGNGVCLPCHTPDATAGAPRATAAALMFARGGLDPRSGRPLTGTPAHASVTGGCVGCHRGGAAGVERGAGHGFQAAPAVCAPCHPRPLAASDLPQQARRLWERWRGDAATAAFPHATGAALDLETPRGRALWNVLLVLEDPAAAAHNARYARALLAASEPVLSASNTR
jgi:hypothetical protein